MFFDLAPRSPPGKRRATVHSISSNVATVAACTIPYVQPTHGTCDHCGCHARGESAQVEVKVVRLPQNHSGTSAELFRTIVDVHPGARVGPFGQVE